MPTGLENDAILTQHETALRRELQRRGYDPEAVLKDVPLGFRVTEGRGIELVLDGGRDPISRAVAVLTAGRPKPKKDYATIRAEVESKYAVDERVAEKQRKLGLRA
jgi:hypothetical protein